MGCVGSGTFLKKSDRLDRMPVGISIGGPMAHHAETTSATAYGRISRRNADSITIMLLLVMALLRVVRIATSFR